MPSRDDIQPSFEGEPSLEYTHGPVSKSISKSTGKFKRRLHKENPEQYQSEQQFHNMSMNSKIAYDPRTSRGQ